MKIEAFGVLRWNGDTAAPVLLDGAYNLADYGFFQRGGFVCPRLGAPAPVLTHATRPPACHCRAKEFMTFAMKTLAKRLDAGPLHRLRR